MVIFSARRPPAAWARIGLAGLLTASGCLTAGAGVAVLSATEASAQGFFYLWDAPPRPRKAVRRLPPIPRMSAEEEKTALLSDREKQSHGPLVLNVSLKTQRVTVYDAAGEVTSAPISSGRVGFPTPTGVFTVLEKNKIHYSNLYDSAPMPNMQRITWSGVALHAGQLPGYPASHGCIRLPHGFSKKLYGMTKLGTRVIVSRDPVAPEPISHKRLFAAFPPEDQTASLPARAPTQVADASNSTVPVAPEASTAGGDSSSIGPPRPTYRQRRLAELAELEARLRTAGYQRMEAEILAVRAAKAAHLTRAALNRAKLAALPFERAAREAADNRDRAAREIAALTKRLETATRMTDRDRQRTADKLVALQSKLPALEAAAAASEVQAAKAAEAVAAAEGPAAEDESKRRAAVENLARASAELAAAVAADQSNKRREARRALPVSVFISRATERLYIRQGYEPVLEVPVTFDEPDQPVGTHVFTAHDYKAGKTEMVWTVVSIPYTAPAAPVAKKQRDRRDAKAEPPPVPVAHRLPQTAAAALERITIPEEVREQIADVMKPGSSLVISDNKLSGETGKYTDFIVSLR
jgi:lipoprotein-anchoring transpeptidase ErfK/SrfK